MRNSNSAYLFTYNTSWELDSRFIRCYTSRSDRASVARSYINVFTFLGILRYFRFSMLKFSNELEEVAPPEIVSAPPLCPPSDLCLFGLCCKQTPNTARKRIERENETYNQRQLLESCFYPMHDLDNFHQLLNCPNYAYMDIRYIMSPLEHK